MDEIKQTLVATTSQLLTVMGFESHIEIEETENRFWIYIETSEPQLLIGRAGANLSPLKHVLLRIIRNRIENPVAIEIDVNSYRKQKISLLREVARTLAERVLSSQKPLFLKPMSAFERRIIHIELAEHNGVITESIGEEPERRLVIKPSLE